MQLMYVCLVPCEQNLKAIRDWFQLSRTLLDGVYYTEDPDGWR
jgi:hypothetical protein